MKPVRPLQSAATNPTRATAKATETEHHEAMLLVLSAARILLAVDIGTALHRAQHALDIGPFFDPTAWMENSDKLREDIKVLAAARPLWEMARKLTTGDEPTT